MDLVPWQVVGEAVGRGVPALIPVGAVEPHGRHCPLGADIFIALEIAERLAERCDGMVFPPVPLGTLTVLYDFRALPGCVSIDSKLLIDVYTNVGLELARQGFARLVFVNGHAPNSAVLSVAQYRIREHAPVEVGILEWWVAAADVIKEIKGFDFGNHADEIETSLLMATSAGHLVDLTQAVVNSPTLDDLGPAETQAYRQKIPFTRTFDERWVGKSGNMGDPTRASPDKGERIIARVVDVGLVLLDALSEQRRPNRDNREADA